VGRDCRRLLPRAGAAPAFLKFRANDGSKRQRCQQQQVSNVVLSEWCMRAGWAGSNRYSVWGETLKKKKTHVEAGIMENIENNINIRELLTVDYL
jgi:hypothetical protein